LIFDEQRPQCDDQSFRLRLVGIGYVLAAIRVQGLDDDAVVRSSPVASRYLGFTRIRYSSRSLAIRFIACSQPRHLHLLIDDLLAQLGRVGIADLSPQPADLGNLQSGPASRTAR
jgi:hypothetical protein